MDKRIIKMKIQIFISMFLYSEYTPYYHVFLMNFCDNVSQEKDDYEL